MARFLNKCLRKPTRTHKFCLTGRNVWHQTHCFYKNKNCHWKSSFLKRFMMFSPRVSAIILRWVAVWFWGRYFRRASHRGLFRMLRKLFFYIKTAFCIFGSTWGHIWTSTLQFIWTFFFTFKLLVAWFQNHSDSILIKRGLEGMIGNQREKHSKSLRSSSKIHDIAIIIENQWFLYRFGNALEAFWEILCTFQTS